MAATPPPELPVLAKYPRMTRWFDPILLLRLIGRVILSDVFGQYADRRLIEAALDPAVPSELRARAPLDSAVPDPLFERAQKHLPGHDNDQVWVFTPDSDGAVWIDFVADLGDGFDATYAIASLLGQESLTVDGQRLPRGQLLMMGGDEVYPRATKDIYRRQLRDPYDWAFPDPHPGLLKGPPVYGIPGNHDWYDGLVVFLALFCRRASMHLGGWRTHQRRSYFAVQLTPTWWLWAMDAQLGDDVDQPQNDYFVAIASRMSPGSRIILCGPEPGWLYTKKPGSKSLSALDFVAEIAWRHHFETPLILSGDTHHYSRYVADDGVTQFITSGGGGAFLHPTHQVEPVVTLNPKVDEIAFGRAKTLTLGTASGSDEAIYPSRAESLALLRGDFAFAFYNPYFSLLLGAFYWLFGMLLVADPVEGAWLPALVLVLGFWGYTAKQEGDTWKVRVVSFANGVLHALALSALAVVFACVNHAWLGGSLWPRCVFAVFAVEMIVVGGLVAGTLFGAYLYVTSRCLDLNHNDAFSAMRRDSHRHFLRLRLTEGAVTIFPIALDAVPKRGDWMKNTDSIGTPPPAFVPRQPLAPHLIEPSITIQPKATDQG